MEKTAFPHDYSAITGESVICTIDRRWAAVTRAPRNLCIASTTVNGVFAGDCAKQDVYVLGIHERLKEFEGIVTAVVRRYNDVEDNWIIVPCGVDVSDAESLKKTAVQERYFGTELYR